MIFPTKPPENLVACRAIHVLILAERMREDEREQYEALAFEPFSVDGASKSFISKGGPAFCLVDPDGNPLCAGGFEPLVPGVWQSWMLGSYEGWENWRAITKASRWVMGNLFAGGARRLQGSCIPTRSAAIEWFKRGLGMDHEGTYRAFGFHGEDLMQFARVNHG